MGCHDTDAFYGILESKQLQALFLRLRNILLNASAKRAIFLLVWA